MSFNHKQHALLKLPCTYCHPGAKTGERAGVPDAAKCKTCHHEDTIGRFPTTQVYTVRDMVFFSHEKHASTDCAECHGKVYEQAPMKVFRATTMKACVECHKQKKATLTCSACHELGQ